MARRYYNGTVRNLNIRIQSFPDVLVARPLGFREQPFFELDDRAAAAVPTVDLARCLIMSMSRDRRRAVAAGRCVAAPAAAQERILSFVSDVRVERNGDLAVTETIRVQAEGREIRRGILRDFPTVYTRRRRHARRGRLRRAVGARATARPRTSPPSGCRTACASASAAPTVSLPTRRAHLCHHLPHHAADRLLRRLRRTLLERDRHRLDLRDRRRGSAHHAAGRTCRSARPRSIPGRRARAAKDATVVEQRAGPHRLSHHEAAAAAQRPDRRRRLAEGRRRRARRGAADAAGGSRTICRSSVAGVGLAAAARLLRDRLAAGRPRSAPRHHHSAVRPAQRHVGGGRALRRRRWASTTAPSPPR